MPARSFSLHFYPIVMTCAQEDFDILLCQTLGPALRLKSSVPLNFYPLGAERKDEKLTVKVSGEEHKKPVLFPEVTLNFVQVFIVGFGRFFGLVLRRNVETESPLPSKGGRHTCPDQTFLRADAIFIKHHLSPHRCVRTLAALEFQSHPEFSVSREASSRPPAKPVSKCSEAALKFCQY